MYTKTTHTLLKRIRDTIVEIDVPPQQAPETHTAKRIHNTVADTDASTQRALYLGGVGTGGGPLYQNRGHVVLFQINVPLGQVARLLEAFGFDEQVGVFVGKKVEQAVGDAVQDEVLCGVVVCVFETRKLVLVCTLLQPNNNQHNQSPNHNHHNKQCLPVYETFWTKTTLPGPFCTSNPGTGRGCGVVLPVAASVLVGGGRNRWWCWWHFVANSIV